MSQQFLGAGLRGRVFGVAFAGLVISAALAVFLLSTFLFSTPVSTQAPTPTHAELKQQCYEGGAAWRGQDGMAEDCATLLGLMDELRGTGTLNWSATRVMTQWDGVTLRGTHLRLQTLRLTRKGLNGTIPAAMGQLTGLRGLYMSYNQLSGTIPDELGQLKGLRYFYLTYNQLSGQIPLSMENLPFRRIGLDGNSFSGCLPAGMRDVEFNDWNLLQLNDCPADAVTLRVTGGAGGTLSVSDGAHVYARNAVATVRATPASGHRILQWGDDCSAVLPTSTMCRLTMDADKTVSVVYKQRPTGPRCVGPGRTAIADPTNLGLVDDCQVLWGLKGRLRGTAPLNWDSRLPITEWEGITLAGTPLRVTKVELATHGLTGSISPKLGELEELERLDLTWNKLGGSIPAELGQLTSLTDLLLFRNNFTGSIPPELGDLANLKFLSLSQNYLSGAIPVELANLSQLQALHLYQNRLTGEIPPALQQLEHLAAISLSENSFSGCIPRDLRSIGSHDLERLSIQPCLPLTLTLTSSRDTCTANTLTELSWEITGGKPPYTLTIEGDEVDANAESYRANCGAISTDSSIGSHETDPKRRFSATVSDSQTNSPNARHEVEVALVEPLEPPPGLWLTSFATKAAIAWTETHEQRLATRPEQGGTYAIRFRSVGTTSWQYRAPYGGPVAWLDLPPGDTAVQVAVLRASIELDTPQALRWTDSHMIARVETPSKASAVSTHDTVTVSWDRQPHTRSSGSVTIHNVHDPTSALSRTFREDADDTSARFDVVFTHLVPSTAYKVTIMYGGHGLGATTRSLDVLTSAAPEGWHPLPRGPQNLRATAGHRWITVEWDPPFAGAEPSYLVQIVDARDGVVIASKRTSKTEWTSYGSFRPILPSTTYRIHVLHRAIPEVEAEIVITTRAARSEVDGEHSRASGESPTNPWDLFWSFRFHPIWPVAIDARYDMIDDPFNWRPYDDGPRFHAGLDIGAHYDGTIDEPDWSRADSIKASMSDVVAVESGYLRIFNNDQRTQNLVYYCPLATGGLLQQILAFTQERFKEHGVRLGCHSSYYFVGVTSGRTAIVIHDGGEGRRYLTKYSHLKKGSIPDKLVRALAYDPTCVDRPGRTEPCKIDASKHVYVTRGDKIGEVGNSFGVHADGDPNEDGFPDVHLHFEIRLFDGVPEHPFYSLEAADHCVATDAGHCGWSPRRELETVEDAERHLPPLPGSSVPLDPGGSYDEEITAIRDANPTRHVVEVTVVRPNGSKLLVGTESALWRPVFYSRYDRQTPRTARPGIAGTRSGVDRYFVTSSCGEESPSALSSPINGDPAVDSNGNPVPAGELPREHLTVDLLLGVSCRIHVLTGNAAFPQPRRAEPSGQWSIARGMEAVDSVQNAGGAESRSDIVLRDPYAEVTWVAELVEGPTRYLPSERLVGNAIHLYSFVAYPGLTYRFCTIPPAPKAPAPAICTDEDSSTNVAELLIVGPADEGKRGVITTGIKSGTQGLVWHAPANISAADTYVLVVRRRDRESQADPDLGSYTYSLQHTIPPPACPAPAGAAGQAADGCPGTPAAPTGAGVSEETATSAKLSWDSSAEGVTYEYRVVLADIVGDEEDKCDRGLTEDGDPTTTTKTFKVFEDLTPSTEYVFCVRILAMRSGEGAGAVVPSAWASAPGTTLARSTAPPVPTGLSVDDVTDTGATLNWIVSPGATGYRVSLDGVELTASLGADVSSYAFSWPSDTAAHVLGVAAVGSGGARSAYAELTILRPPTITGSTVTQDSITASWSSVAKAKEYHLKAVTADHCDSDESFETVRGTSASVGLLPAETTHRFCVRATNDEGSSAWSSVTRTTLAATAVALGIDAGSIGGDGTVNIEEQAAVIAIGGSATAGASVSVTVGGTTLPAVTADASGRWSVNVPANSAYIAESAVSVVAVATKDGETASASASFAVDLTAPAVTYPMPASLTVGVSVTINPTTLHTDIASYTLAAGQSLPAGLSLTASTGVVSGAPSVTSSEETVVSITVTDRAANSSTATLTLPPVSRTTEPKKVKGEIRARKLADGRVEVEFRTADGDSIQPSPVRFFTPGTMTPGSWYNSSSIEVTVGGVSYEVGRISVQLDNDQCPHVIVVALRPPVGEPIEPTEDRYDYRRRAVNAWVKSSMITIPLTTSASGAVEGDWLSMEAAGDGYVAVAGVDGGTMLARMAGGVGGDGVTGAVDAMPALCPPLNPEVTDISSGSLILRWDPVAEATGHKVRLNMDGAEVTASSVNTHPFSGLDPSTLYTLYVRSTRGTEESDWAFVSETTLSASSATVSIDASAIGGDGTVNIRERAAGFAIGGRATVGASVVLTVGGTALPAVTADASGRWSANVPANSTYIRENAVSVVAMASKAGRTSASATASFAVDLTAPRPRYPTVSSLKVDASATIAPMTSDTDIASYALAAGQPLPAGLSLTASTGVVSGTPSARGDAGTTNKIAVRDRAGNVATVTLSLPRVEGLAQVLAGFSYSPDEVELGGDAPTLSAPTGAVGALTYTADDDTNCTVDPNNGALTIKAVGSCAVTATTAATSRYEAGTAETTVTIVAKPMTLDTPVLSLSDVGKDSVTMSWTTVPGAEAYELRWCDSSDCEHETTALSYKVPDLSEATPYTFEVRATSPSKTASEWATATATTNVETRIRARRLSNGKVEWVLRFRTGDDLMPTHRFADPTKMTNGNWHQSETLSRAFGDGTYTLGKVSIRLDNTICPAELEVTFLPGDGMRKSPDMRKFPLDTAVNTWLTTDWFELPLDDSVASGAGGVGGSTAADDSTLDDASGVADPGPGKEGGFMRGDGPSGDQGVSGSSTSDACADEPSGLTASSISASGATLRWNAVTGATQYDVRRDEGTSTELAKTATSSQFTGLRAGTTYSLEVRARNPEGASGWSRLSVTTIPPTPSGLSASATTTSLTLTWSGSRGATSYEVKRSGSTTEKRKASSSRSHKFEGLNGDSEYTLFVRALNTSGASAWATVKKTTERLKDPTNVSADNATSSSLRLNWGGVSEATSYEVKRSGSTNVETKTSSARSHEFDGLDANTSYTLSVRALNAGGSSNWVAATGRTIQAPPPTYTFEGRSRARIRSTGRVEFCFQPRGGECILPSTRYVTPSSMEGGRWYSSGNVIEGGRTLGKISVMRPAGATYIDVCFTPAGGTRACPTPNNFYWGTATVDVWRSAGWRTYTIADGVTGSVESVPPDPASAMQPANADEPVGGDFDGGPMSDD